MIRQGAGFLNLHADGRVESDRSSDEVAVKALHSHIHSAQPTRGAEVERTMSWLPCTSSSIASVRPIWSRTTLGMPWELPILTKQGLITVLILETLSATVTIFEEGVN